MPYRLVPHHSHAFFCMYFAVPETESSLKGILYMQLVSKIKELILAIFTDYTSCVTMWGIASHAVG